MIIRAYIPVTDSEEVSKAELIGDGYEIDLWKELMDFRAEHISTMKAISLQLSNGDAIECTEVGMANGDAIVTLARRKDFLKAWHDALLGAGMVTLEPTME